MTQLSRKQAPKPTATPLRRAEVVSIVDEDSVLLRLGDEKLEELLRAELAVPGYQPEPQDWVLLSHDGTTHYVVGVLGEARRRQPEVLALKAARRLVLSAPEIEVRAGSLELAAHTLVERSHSSHRFTEDVAAQQAGRLRVGVGGALEVHADRVTIAADGDSVIDGKRVLLG